MSMDEVRQGLDKGKSFSTELVSGEKSYLCIFLPIRNGEWYTLVATPTEEILAKVSEVMDKDFYWMLASVLICMGTLSAIILVLNYRTHVWQRQYESKVRETLMSKVVGLMVADLDDNRILSRSGRGMLREALENISYSGYIDDMAEFAEDEQKESLRQFFNAQNIIADAKNGLHDRSWEFLFPYMPGKGKAWLECESRVDRDERTGHLLVSHILRDIDSRKQEELSLRTLAERDMLTGLFNRSTGSRLINMALKAGSHNDHSAFILVDLDNFKTLNDTLGHQYGDQALKDVAKILNSHFRRDDIVCRLGGDEFIIFLINASEELVFQRMESLLQKLNLPYEEDGQTVRIAASAGIAYAARSDTFETLYPKADQALYQSKRAGKGRFRVYT